MPASLDHKQHRNLLKGVIAPVAAAFVIAIIALVGFIVWSMQSVDDRSLARQTNFMASAVNQLLRGIEADQDSVTVWDEAVTRTSTTPDTAWIAFNLGSWMYSFFGHDSAFVLGADDRPVYAMVHGATAEPAAYDEQGTVLHDLVAQLRTRLRDQAAPAEPTKSSARRPRLSDFAVLNGKPSIVSIAPIVSDTGHHVQQPGTEFIHISTAMLDEALATRIAGQFLFNGLRFTLEPEPAAGRVIYPIRSASGRFIAFVEWEPDRPSSVLLGRLLPALGIAGLLAFTLVILLMVRLWRSSMELERGRREAQYRATHDGLTGLANRSLFEERVSELAARADNAPDGTALMMLDLDRFKQINDALGHGAGDQLIRAVAQRLQSLLSEDDLLARLGGDEFGLLHTTRRGRAEALALSHRIIEAVSKPFEINGFEAFVGVSVGIVMVQPDGTDHVELTRRADIALYEAKATGRNRAMIYESRMGDDLQSRHLVEAELREALRNRDQLSVAYQPLFGRDRVTVVGAEALVRWTNPDLGRVSPALFIPIAESTGLIEQLGMMVLGEAVKLGARWPGRVIAVNVSPAQLRNPRFATDVLVCLENARMQPSGLELEITEGSLLADEPVTQNNLRMLRGAGIRIALDDFGTGYSSLSYLRRYAVDRIKIDRSFTSRLDDDETSVAIVQAMINLTHAMGMEVTAEGVETEAQYNALAAMACDTYQGYLMSPPVSLDQVEAVFRTMGGVVTIAA